MEGRVASVIHNSGATSHCGKEGDPFKKMGRKSTKVFGLPTGDRAPASDEVELLIGGKDKANIIDMVPGMQNMLLSDSKIADKNYIQVLAQDEVHIFDADKTNIYITCDEAKFKGWQDPATGF